MSEKLQGDKKGGLLDMLINKNQLPEVSVTLSKETIFQIGLMLVISISILILLNIVVKQIFSK